MSITVLIHGATRPTGDASGKSVATLTFDAPRIVLGRGEGCEVRLPDPSVSHRHASIRQRGAEYLLVDEGSTNGTRMGRVLLSAHSPRAIRSSQITRIGRVWLELRVEPAAPSTGSAVAAKEIALDLVSEALAEQGEDARPRVVVEEGPDAGAELRIDPGVRHVVGRSKDAHFPLEDAELSRRHLEIARKGDVLVVRDLGSKGGGLLGDRPLGTTDLVWKPADRLTIGQTVLRYSFDAAEALLEIERSPDEKLTPADLEIGEEPEIAAPDDPVIDDFDEQALATGVSTALTAQEPEIERMNSTKRRRGSSWGVTDFAVVLLALGVVSLSAVGYFALLH